MLCSQPVANVRNRPVAAGQAVPGERQLSNNCGHSRVGRFDSQNAMNGRCGGLALSATTCLSQTSLSCHYRVRSTLKPAGWPTSATRPKPSLEI